MREDNSPWAKREIARARRIEKWCVDHNVEIWMDVVLIALAIALCAAGYLKWF